MKKSSFDLTLQLEYIAFMSLKKQSLLFLCAVLLSTGTSFARPSRFERSPNVEAPQLFEQLTINFGSVTTESVLPGPGLRMYVWNVHKGKDAGLIRDFQENAADADLALFQEAVSYPQFTEALVAANPNLGWTLAKSFSLSEEIYTGVATGSRVRPAYEEVIVSIPTEPISKTHKTILLSQFFVAFQKEPLLVANIHGINFVTNRAYRIQIQQLMARVREHEGPLIIGGDFNTWNPLRLAYLRSEFSRIGLKLIYTPTKCHLFNLDHIFVRGLQLRSATNLDYIKTSDHVPVKVDLVFEPQAKIKRERKRLSNLEFTGTDGLL